MNFLLRRLHSAVGEEPGCGLTAKQNQKSLNFILIKKTTLSVYANKWRPEKWPVYWLLFNNLSEMVLVEAPWCALLSRNSEEIKRGWREEPESQNRARKKKQPHSWKQETKAQKIKHIKIRFSPEATERVTGWRRVRATEWPSDRMKEWRSNTLREQTSLPESAWA